MNQMGSQNGMDELDVIDADSQKISAMLGALPRADAPANFEFRVKARIASGASRRITLTPIFRTAAPLVLVLIAITSGVLYYEWPTRNGVVPIDNMAISQPASPAAKSEPVQPPPSTAPSASEFISGQPERASAPVPRARQAPRTGRSILHSDGGNSVDRIIHPANVIMPPGFESANPQKRNANTGASSPMSTPARDVLTMFGIAGDFADGGWKVRSVKENSIGARAKIAAGDVIESIDGQQLNNDAKLKGGAKTFTVRREGKLVTLSSTN